MMKNLFQVKVQGFGLISAAFSLAFSIIPISKGYFSLNRDIKSFPIDRNTQIDRHFTGRGTVFLHKKADTGYGSGSHGNNICTVLHRIKLCPKDRKEKWTRSGGLRNGCGRPVTFSLDNSDVLGADSQSVEKQKTPQIV